jgi:hypothetical protein
MKCTWVTDRISSFVDGELSSDEAGRIREHLDVCRTCRKQVQEVRNTVKLLRSAKRLRPSSSFNAELAVALRGVRRDEATSPDWWGRIWRPVPVPQPLIAAAAFVVVLVVGGVILGPYFGGEPTETMSVSESIQPEAAMMTESRSTISMPESLMIGIPGEPMSDVEYVLDEIVVPQPQASDEVRAVSGGDDGKTYITF